MAASKSKDKIPAVVVVVPFQAQGHMNQFLHLSSLISHSSNIPIHYASSTALISQAKSRFTGSPLTNIIFHQFSIPTFQSPPSPTTATSSGQFAGLFQPSSEASCHLRQPVFELLKELSVTTERLVVICDFLASVAIQDIVSVPNAEAYIFHGVSAFMSFSFFWELFGKPNIIQDPTVEYLPPIDSSFTPEFVEHINKNLELTKLMSGIIYDGCRVLEGKYIDLINSKEMMGPDVKQWALGPLNPVTVTPNQNHEALKWLDKQSTNSVIYVCFGTAVLFSDQQLKELAIGLENSGQKFIWVLRNADKEALPREEEAIDTKLPNGYEERVKDRGIIIKDWAPQVEILGHSSTGGFLSHCGWNSCMESLTMGVPILAWPMHSDQPRNSLLITKGLKAGIIVRDWALTEELLTWSTVEKAVKRLMGSPEGEEIRKRAEEVGAELRESMAEGGITRAELGSFISHISR